MLRVGLTGGLGSGKSTAARLLAAHGAHVLQSDVIGRELMMMRRDGGLYDAIVARFGPEVVLANGKLDRAALAKIAFTEGRVEELNAIVHPAVIARQAELMQRIFDDDPAAVVVLESALIFETKHGGKNGWRSRFDCVVLVTAPEDIRIERYVSRMSEGSDDNASRRKSFAAEARHRIKHQMSDVEKTALADYVLTNAGPIQELEWQVDQLWPILKAASEANLPRAGER